MFSQYEIDLVNAELADIATEATNAAVELMFEDMIAALSYEYWMAESAAHSYDEDAIAYGSW